MPFDAFLKIDGIDGESVDDKHREWIECLSYQHGVTQSTTVLSTGARTTERADHQDFTVVKTLDKASPKLALAVCNGQHIQEITIELARASGDRTKYMVYVMTDVIVTSFKPDGNTQGADERPLEEISFNYGKIEWTYTELDRATGTSKGDVTAYWDVESNRGG